MKTLGKAVVPHNDAAAAYDRGPSRGEAGAKTSSSPSPNAGSSTDPQLDEIGPARGQGRARAMALRFNVRSTLSRAEITDLWIMASPTGWAEGSLREPNENTGAGTCTSSVCASYRPPGHAPLHLRLRPRSSLIPL